MMFKGNQTIFKIHHKKTFTTVKTIEKTNAERNQFHKVTQIFGISEAPKISQATNKK